jgi:hypothetical protein
MNREPSSVVEMPSINVTIISQNLAWYHRFLRSQAQVVGVMLQRQCPESPPAPQMLLVPMWLQLFPFAD